MMIDETVYDNPGINPTGKKVKVTDEEAKEIARNYYRYDRIAPERVASINEIDQQRIHRYKEQGYLIVENMLTSAEIEGGLQEIHDIIFEKLEGPKLQIVKSQSGFNTPEEREFAVRKVSHFIRYAPVLGSIARHPVIHEVAGKLLNEDPKLISYQALLKPPLGGSEKPWHQDMAYGGLFYKKQIVTAWIALDEAGLDNGCMHIIPRSHLRGGVPHYFIRDWQLCDTHVDVENDVAATLSPGSVLFFSGLLYHGTPANFSEKRRRSVQLRFAGASSELMSKDEYKIMFTHDLIDVEC